MSKPVYIDGRLWRKGKVIKCFSCKGKMGWLVDGNTVKHDCGARQIVS